MSFRSTRRHNSAGGSNTFIGPRTKRCIGSLGDVVPPGLRLALEAEEVDAARERERLWYVACTRARDLLVLPDISGAGGKSWAKVVDLDRSHTPILDLSSLSPSAVVLPADRPNGQGADEFVREHATIKKAAAPVQWFQLGHLDKDKFPAAEITIADAVGAPDMQLPIGAGRVRGLLLHKLIEEVLTGETHEDVVDLTSRAQQLLAELLVSEAGNGLAPDAREIAQTVGRTLALPEVTALRPNLLVEIPLYAVTSTPSTTEALAGRADAVEVVNGRAKTIVDWKSDIAPTEVDVSMHLEQVGNYIAASKAETAILVYMTSGTVLRAGRV